MGDVLQERDDSVYTASANIVITRKIQGDTNNRYQQTAGGTMSWGSGSATPDVNLYRSAADTLATDDLFSALSINVGTEAVAAAKVSRLPKVAKVALSATAGNGGVLAFTPGVACIVTRLVVNRTTATGGACTIDFGVAADATTSSDTLIDGLDANASADVADNITDKGTNGKSRQKMTSSQYITGTVATGTVTGLVGFAYIEFIEI